jgi:hypothetical protein
VGWRVKGRRGAPLERKRRLAGFMRMKSRWFAK